ncbi:3-dehydroquinate synthase [Rugosibacter aromaticivorans]|uniref:3-dehydroquinate synthase n=1 Tax=Rugosibacter aromaticivorans TaxID=1565605 RepID=A0A0C5J1W8_9PROT|nr:3-dehydroquinate synthase [Rugosibacter aromaticivorans]AJP49067.1 3-dehydroquinate synthase [Rugosibacter aromaticivorans]TBR15780.1 MAG: 3-dehydroquinate synthase [Rugosibacter sp.]
MRRLNVALAERSYPILIGSDLLQNAENLPPYLQGPRVAVISNTTVAPLYLDTLLATLEKVGVGVTPIILPDGEKFKNWESLNAIYDALLAARCDRGTTLIALGGGVIGDLAGFAAATYQRGVPFIQIPTTLLSQVDSSVGGKTGINHPRGKNMVGAFWQPKLVVADTLTLRSLPARELSAGLAEVIKYGLVRDLPFLEWLESNMDRLVAGDDEALAYAIERSCRNKAEVVANDEFETAKEGGRALLNLGHTFGHAIESGMGYGHWLHGEAVAAGTVMAAELSRRLGWLSAADVDRVRNLLQRAGLPVCGPMLGAERYLEFMSNDKKVSAGRLRLVLLQSIGTAVTTSDATREDILATLTACCHE